VIFWDTSAVVRCYSRGESGRDRAINLLSSKERHAGSVLLLAEAAGALSRQAGANRPLAERAIRKMRDDLGSFELIPTDVAQAELAARMAADRRVHGADAIHIACAFLIAREFRRRFRFVTSDIDQAAAARSEKLKVILVN
jgi:predicted nucleic acid-binding protein